MQKSKSALFLMELIIVIFFSGAIAGLVPIPGGKIHSKADAARAAGLRCFCHHVAPPVFIGAGRHGMVGIPAGPQAEAVVMLAGENQPFHARGLDGLHPLLGIQLLGIENGGVLRAVPPFPIRKGVHGKMDKGVEFHILQGDLPGSGNDLNQLLVRHDAASMKYFFYEPFKPLRFREQSTECRVQTI